MLTQTLQKRLMSVVKPRADDVVLDVFMGVSGYIVYIYNTSKHIGIKYLITSDFVIQKKEIL